MRDEVKGAKCEGGTTLVCFALKEEAAPFRKLVADRTDVSILITGIGCANAERAARKFLQSSTPRQVFTCGFAGGLNPDLKVGDVVFEIPPGHSRGEKGQIEKRNAFESPDVGCYEKLIAAGARPGKFVCVSHIATTAGEKQQLRATTQADVVEMESAAIHAVCRELGIPCITIRGISDTVHEDLPLDFNQLSNPDQSLNFGRLALAIAKSPGKIPALLRLQKNASRAGIQLANIIAHICQV